MAPNPRFDKLAADARSQVREVSALEAKALQDEGALLIDVRETEEYSAGHAAGATHLSRGMIELKIEELAPDPATPIICYCGGGKRSALSAVSLRQMGYCNVASLVGGFRAWTTSGLPTE
jgi:rhodanese-related sulfurtransferase